MYFNQSLTQAQFLPPVMLASCVENIWYMINPVSSKQHLAESLWLACGAQGMQVTESKKVSVNEFFRKFIKIKTY